MKSESKEKGKYIIKHIIKQNKFYTFSFSFHFINLQKLILKSFLFDTCNRIMIMNKNRIKTRSYILCNILENIEPMKKRGKTLRDGS